MGCYLPWGCLFLVLSIVYSRFPSSSGCIMEERAALMDISSWIVSIKSEVPSSWENGDDCCSWKRIMCDNSTRRILRLDLSQIYQPNASYGSDGSTSAEADVPCFNLNMTIFSSFRELQLLDFSGNYACLQNFNGLQGLRKLKYLNLSDNTFIESIPVSIRKLVSLEVINLRGNNMSGALQNTGFKNLRNLRELNLGSNQLSGSLPASVFALPCLEYLDLSENLFQGHIPINSSWKCSSMLQTIRLSENMLSGRIPNCNAPLPLEFLSVSRNSLSGFPSAFFNSSYIEVLDLSHNQFTGSIEWTQYLYQIKVLLLSRNKFEGQISTNLNHLQYLSIIDISHNKISGPIPPCIGVIPFEDPDDNLYNWPTAPGSLFGGGFDGMDFSYSNHYDLQGFTFTTKWNSYTYGRNFFMSMSGIDLSANMLSGEIPMEIGNLSHIKSLNLSNNFFTGSIPATFANLSEIESLDLSENRLNGSIPRQLTRLSSLEVFSVAYNNLSGCLPDSGQFGAFGMDSYRGNSNLRSCTSSSGPVAWNGTVGNVADDTDPILYVVSAVSFVLAFWATVTFVFCHSFGQRVILNL
ncbi:hypothetical protein ACQ4PT_052706 [Festuca glaucescens]